MDLIERLRTALADRYRVERKIGAGGMATVYLAEDLKHRRQVAIKVLKPELAAVMGAERFTREIETAARLQHPHILPLYDSGDAAGDLYYVMPYVEGESLRQRLDREKQLPIEDALKIAREVGDALSYAHARDVVHRDIKPENILLAGGHAVVSDFGIARAVTAAGGERLTETGLAIGTPTYMSPEQAAGSADVDGRSDLYSLGCVLYEMLAGQAPFTGPSVESVINQHLTAEPPNVTAIRPAVPAEVVGVLARALAKTPADRFSPVGQFVEALSRREPVAVAASAPTSRAANPWRTGALAVAALGAIGVAGFLILSRDAGSPPLEFGRTQQVTREPGLEVDPALSADGRFVAYAAGRPTAMRLFVRPVSGGDPVPISEGAPGSHRYPRWSPDGSQVLFSAAGALWTVPPLGGSPRAVVREDNEVGWGTWSPDGQWMAYMETREATDRSLVVRAVDGRERRELAAGGDLHSPSWSPDGRFIAYVRGNYSYWYGNLMGNLSPSEVLVVPADGSGEPLAVAGGGHMHGSPTWMPDSRTLLLVSTRSGGLDAHRAIIDDRGRLTDSLERVTTGIGASSVSASADGRQLVYSVITNTSNIWAVDITGTLPVSVREAVPVTTGTEHVEGLAVSPDGRWLAFDSDRGGDPNIWKVPVTGGNPIQLTTGPAGDFYPEFSRDGERIVFHSWRTGSRDIFIMAADGSRLEQVTDDRSHESVPTTTTDGARIVFQSDRSGRFELYMTERTADGWSVPRQVTTAGGSWSRWSPDGRTIAYGGVNAGVPDVVNVLDVTTGREHVLLRSFARDGVIHVPGALPQWMPDGRRIMVKATDENGRAGIWDIPAEGGTPRLLVTFDDPSRPSGRQEFTTDGSRIYFTVDNRQSDIWVVDVVQGGN